MHPAILLDISTSKASGSTLNSHVYLKKLTLTEQDLALNSTPLIYDSILYLFHKIHIFRAGFVLATVSYTLGQLTTINPREIIIEQLVVGKFWEAANPWTSHSKSSHNF